MDETHDECQTQSKIFWVIAGSTMNAKLESLHRMHRLCVWEKENVCVWMAHKESSNINLSKTNGDANHALSISWKWCKFLLRKSGKKLNRYVYRWDQQGLMFFSIFFAEKRDVSIRLLVRFWVKYKGCEKIATKAAFDFCCYFLHF